MDKKTQDHEERARIKYRLWNSVNVRFGFLLKGVLVNEIASNNYILFSLLHSACVERSLYFVEGEMLLFHALIYLNNKLMSMSTKSQYYVIQFAVSLIKHYLKN